MGTDGIWSEGRDTRVGDEVHVVLGCPVPLVLRKLGGTKHDCARVTVKVSPKRPQISNSNAAAANSEPNSSVASSSSQPKVSEDDTTLSTGIATETDHDGDGIENNAVSEERNLVIMPRFAIVITFTRHTSRYTSLSALATPTESWMRRQWKAWGLKQEIYFSARFESLTFLSVI